MSAFSRLQGLESDSVQLIVAAAQALELGRQEEAALHLSPLLSTHPDHPEVLRLHAGILNLRGDLTSALVAMRHAVELRPGDPLYLNTLGIVLGAIGDFDAAISVLRRACELQPNLAVAWFNLGIMQTRCVRNEEAVIALKRAVACAPEYMAARALLADMLRVSGHVGEAATEYRKMLLEQPWTGMAWWGLADLKTLRFTPGDVESMRRAMRDSRAGDDDRIAIGFAMAKAFDDAGRYADALDALAQANALARRRSQWNATTFSSSIDEIAKAFTPLIPGVDTVAFGREVMFVVGLPRSGTTLVEQILASHSTVEGAGELPDLSLVLAEESRHRGKPFPRWVAEMKPADWQRLGKRYLERTAHWRRRRPIFIDKMPSNWMYIGAIRAMLPAAHIVICRRDPLETCFSCYRQHLAGNDYTRTFTDLAAFWRDFDRCAGFWRALHPAHVYEHYYEGLVTDPGQGIRKLLDFCGLPFEETCLRFHETERDVRSPSASQVRQPLRADTARAPHYGALLDPLRTALGMPAFASNGLLTELPALCIEVEWLETARMHVLRGELPVAQTVVAQALTRYPHSIELRRVQAGILQESGDTPEAESLFRQLLAQNPGDAPAAFALARMLKEQGRMAAAATIMRGCFTEDLNCRDADLAINAIELLDDCGRKSDAAAVAEIAIAANPGDMRLRAYAGMQIQLGNFERARQHYLCALTQDERAWEWHVPIGLSATLRYTNRDHPDFALFRVGLQRDGLSALARAEICFALGKAHDDIGDHERATRHFREGNSIARRLTKWSRATWQRAVEAKLAAKPIARRVEGCDDFRMVFIVGMPRSGTTLLAELLSRHPLVCNRGESPCIAKLAEQPGLNGSPDDVTLQRAAAIYAAQMRQDDAPDARWFVDKQPLNLRYADLMLALFPNAKIIHCQRGARDTALSLWMQCFLEDVQAYAYDFADIALVMRDCDRLMTQWHRRYPDSIRTVHYEEMVADEQIVTADLAKWIGLPPRGPETASARKASGISTSSLWQARQPVYSRSVGRWRYYAPYVPELLTLFES
jgi:tetratricopeptide (TPR) repeat protein